MAWIELDYLDNFRPMVEALTNGGAILVGAGSDGKPNPMTIGWATMGTIWGRPIMMAMVRPSRYTYGLLEESGDFTVNVMPKSMAGAVSYCGTYSGRSRDKLQDLSLVPVAGRHVKAPAIEQASLVIECRVVQKTDLDPSTLLPDIQRSAYPKGDFHRLYFGEIVASYGDPEKIGR